MSTEIIIDQDALKKEIEIKRQFKSELESELKSLKEEASSLKKSQDILTLARNGMNSGIDIALTDNEIKSINDQVWKLLKIIQERQNAIGYYERLITRLESFQD